MSVLLSWSVDCVDCLGGCWFSSYCTDYCSTGGDFGILQCFLHGSFDHGFSPTRDRDLADPKRSNTNVFVVELMNVAKGGEGESREQTR